MQTNQEIATELKNFYKMVQMIDGADQADVDVINETLEKAMTDRETLLDMWYATQFEYRHLSNTLLC